MKIIGVDTGNRCIKTSHAAPFDAGLVYHGTTPPAVSVDTLFYKGRYYSLSATRGAYRQDKTTDEQYFILTLFAIAREILVTEEPKSSYEREIILSLGLPLSHVQNLRGRYQTHFSGRGEPVKFSYNGIPFKITIREVMVFAQGFAAIAQPEYYESISKRAVVFALDIGGYTTDIIKLVWGKPQMDFCVSYDKGVIHLYQQVHQAIANEFQIDIPDVMIDAILQDTENPNPAVSAAVKDVAKRYAQELFHFLEDQKVDFKISHLVFLGGGSLLMKDTLFDLIPQKDVTIIPDIRANARGYERQALAVCKKRKASRQ